MSRPRHIPTSDMTYPYLHGVRILEPSSNGGGGDGGGGEEERDPIPDFDTILIRMSRPIGGTSLFTAVRYNGVGYGLQVGVVSGTQWYATTTGPEMLASQYNNVGNTRRIDDIEIDVGSLFQQGIMPLMIDYYVVRWYPAVGTPNPEASVIVSRKNDSFATPAFGVTPQDITVAAPGGRFSGYQFTIDVNRFIRNQMPFVG